MDKRLKIGLIVGFAIAIVLAGVFIYARLSLHQFEITSHNGVLGVESIYPEVRYNYTVFAEVKHIAGDKNTLTLYCELTREDLTTITKQQSITLSVGESKIVRFFFSNEDLEGKTPNQYKIYGE